MTDTSPSESAPDFGHPSSSLLPANSPPQSDPAGQDGVSNSLAELEHKLRELESKLNAMGTEPEQPSPPAAASNQPAISPEPTSFGVPAVDPLSEDFPARLIDEASADDAPVIEEPSPEYQSRLVDEAVQPDTQSSPEGLAPETLAELLSFRERLERVTQDLLEDYNELLTRLTDQSADDPEPEPASEAFQTFAAPEPEAQAPPAREIPEPTSDSFQTFAPLEPEAQAPPPEEPAQETAEPTLPPLSEPAQTPPVTSEAKPALSEQELTQFAGHVELGGGPFYNDMRWLSEFEIRLGRIPNVTKASVRRVEAGHAVLDLELSAPVALLAELRTAVDSDFEIREISENRLAITLEDS